MSAANLRRSENNLQCKQFEAIIKLCVRKRVKLVMPPLSLGETGKTNSVSFFFFISFSVSLVLFILGREIYIFKKYLINAFHVQSYFPEMSIKKMSLLSFRISVRDEYIKIRL